MADKSFHLDIITPDEQLYSGRVTSLIAPCSDGYLGVLKDHAPLLALAVSGKITFRKDTGELTVLNTNGTGFLEVNRNQVSLILKRDDVRRI